MASSVQAGDPAKIPLADIVEDVFHSLPVGLIVFDRTLRIAHRNPAAHSLFPEHSLVSDVLNAGTVKGQYQDWPTELRRVVDAGRQERYDGVVYQEGERDECLLNLVCTPLRSSRSGQVIGAVLAAEDVTRRVSLERRLAVSERLAAVGKLAARVAHELNNPLDGILRYINLARRLADEGGEDAGAKVSGYLEKARVGLTRMTNIVQDLLEFSRSAPVDGEQGNVNSVLEEAIRTMSEVADRNRVTITADFRNDRMPPVRGSRLYQVFCNLIKNAVDAMAGGGRLTIMSALCGDDVVVRFEDSGPGLPEETEQVFEPFYTTKQVGKGTGLGLAICRDFVERLHGTITASNREEGGASFVVRVPAGSLATEAPDR